MKSKNLAIRKILQKSDKFELCFMVSLGLHLAVLGAGGLFAGQWQYSVEEAPTSIEVQLVEERQEKPVREEVIVEKIDSLPGAEVKVPEPPEEKEEEFVEYTPPIKGAVVEAAPTPVTNPAPVYPRVARQNGWEGLVTLRVLVEKDGLPGRIEILGSSGHKILDEEALETVKEWRFTSARSGGMQFSSWISIPIRFKLVN